MEPGRTGWARLGSESACLLQHFVCTSESYVLHVTDLQRAWIDSVDRDGLVARAERDKCAVDVRESENRKVLLQRLAESLESTNAEISTSGNELTVGVKLKSSGPQVLQWTFRLHPVHSNTFMRDFCLGTFGITDAFEAQISELKSVISEKDHHINAMNEIIKDYGAPLYVPRRFRKTLPPFDFQAWRTEWREARHAQVSALSMVSQALETCKGWWGYCADGRWSADSLATLAISNAKGNPDNADYIRTSNTLASGKKCNTDSDEDIVIGHSKAGNRKYSDSDEDMAERSRMRKYSDKGGMVRRSRKHNESMAIGRRERRKDGDSGEDLAERSRVKSRNSSDSDSDDMVIGKRSKESGKYSELKDRTIGRRSKPKSRNYGDSDSEDMVIGGSKAKSRKYDSDSDDMVIGGSKAKSRKYDSDSDDMVIGRKLKKTRKSSDSEDMVGRKKNRTHSDSDDENMITGRHNKHADSHSRQSATQDLSDEATKEKAKEPALKAAVPQEVLLERQRKLEEQVKERNARRSTVRRKF